MRLASGFSRNAVEKPLDRRRLARRVKVDDSYFRLPVKRDGFLINPVADLIVVENGS